jgi:small multidrug resistance pump
VSLATFLVLAIAVPIFTAAATLSRIYVSEGRVFLLVFALVLYTVGNILMVRLMRDMGLGVAVSLATIAQLVLINLVAFLVFQERATPTQLAGIVFGVVGMALILLPRGS